MPVTPSRAEREAALSPQQKSLLDFFRRHPTPNPRCLCITTGHTAADCGCGCHNRRWHRL